MKNTKKKRGGKRKGAGRKSLDDKKIRVSIWMRESEIKKNVSIVFICIDQFV